ncbi:MAG: hypothetical protein IJ319_03835 [Bacteroidaceae bacterium]|nr:hypothetical protein [Bacteroidaceae bacterium]
MKKNNDQGLRKAILAYKKEELPHDFVFNTMSAIEQEALKIEKRRKYYTIIFTVIISIILLSVFAFITYNFCKEYISESIRLLKDTLSFDSAKPQYLMMIVSTFALLMLDSYQQDKLNKWRNDQL